MTSSEKEPNDAFDSDLYIEDFTEMLRDILRAVAANDNFGALTSASRRLRNLVRAHEHLPPELNWYKILEASVRNLKAPCVPFDDPASYEHDYDRLAKYGVKLVAELTTSDNFSDARISKARGAMANEIDAIDRLRQVRRELRNAD